MTEAEKLAMKERDLEIFAFCQGGIRDRSLAAAGRKWGLSKERIRQIVLAEERRHRWASLSYKVPS